MENSTQKSLNGEGKDGERRKRVLASGRLASDESRDVRRNKVGIYKCCIDKMEGLNRKRSFIFE
jgi:hypothetical protein